MREAHTLDDGERESLVRRDILLRNTLLEHERAAGEVIMGKERARALASAMAGPIDNASA